LRREFAGLQISVLDFMILHKDNACLAYQKQIDRFYSFYSIISSF